jgi:formyl-CoA transferase
VGQIEITAFSTQSSLLTCEEAVLNLIRISLREHQPSGVPVRTGNQLGKTVPGTTYPCAPGGPNDWVYIYAPPQMWSAVCKVLERPELGQNPLFKTPVDRWADRAALDAIVAESTSKRSKYEATKLMGDASVPAGAGQDTAEVLADPHLKARDMIRELDYPPRGKCNRGLPVKAFSFAGGHQAALDAGRTYRRARSPSLAACPRWTRNA